jgi:hypothetical protein
VIPNQEWDNLRAKLITLLAINIYEPVKLGFLKQKLKSQIDTSKIKGVLTELTNEKKVAVESKHYRLTCYGLNKSVVPQQGRILRDIHRMEYLVNLSKKRGGM